ncbi:hypothetical protein [Nocardia arthritidis]|uniref:Outer membrane channel protein CpnT-like N-terminal domain-containing protein n=1 Tax=Nocardia arthritidis TaxID=228602 RepID=A0A6G9Y7C9_9NOCA|nr:hypothetical protein [Nocardia arthritidis]QIS08963.1 hypothetical protein F5544_05255 [Nocardia arthritidis]
MSLYLPEGLRWLGWVAGAAWPDGDEDKMFELAAAWEAAAEELDGVPDDIRAARNSIGVAYHGGKAGEAMQAKFDPLLSGPQSVQELATSYRALSETAFNAGTDMEAAKLTVIVSLAMLAAEILWAWVFPVTAAAAETAAINATRSWMRQVEDKLTKLIEKGAEWLFRNAKVAKFVGTYSVKILESVAISGLLDITVQQIQVWKGHRHGINWGQVGLSMAASAAGTIPGREVAGFVGTKFDKFFAKSFQLNGREGRWMSMIKPSVGDSLKGIATGATSGAVGTFAGNLVMIGAMGGFGPAMSSAEGWVGGISRSAIVGGARGMLGVKMPSSTGRMGLKMNTFDPTLRPSLGPRGDGTMPLPPRAGATGSGVNAAVREIVPAQAGHDQPVVQQRVVEPSGTGSSASVGEHQPAVHERPVAAVDTHPQQASGSVHSNVVEQVGNSSGSSTSASTDQQHHGGQVGAGAQASTVAPQPKASVETQTAAAQPGSSGQTSAAGGSSTGQVSSTNTETSLGQRGQTPVTPAQPGAGAPQSHTSGSAQSGNASGPAPARGGASASAATPGGSDGTRSPVVAQANTNELPSNPARTTSQRSVDVTQSAEPHQVSQPMRDQAAGAAQRQQSGRDVPDRSGAGTPSDESRLRANDGAAHNQRARSGSPRDDDFLPPREDDDAHRPPVPDEPPHVGPTPEPQGNRDPLVRDQTTRSNSAAAQDLRGEPRSRVAEQQSARSGPQSDAVTETPRDSTVSTPIEHQQVPPVGQRGAETSTPQVDSAGQQSRGQAVVSSGDQGAGTSTHSAGPTATEPTSRPATGPSPAASSEAPERTGSQNPEMTEPQPNSEHPLTTTSGANEQAPAVRPQEAARAAAESPRPGIRDSQGTPTADSGALRHEGGQPRSSPGQEVEPTAATPGASGTEGVSRVRSSEEVQSSTSTSGAVGTAEVSGARSPGGAEPTAVMSGSGGAEEVSGVRQSEAGAPHADTSARRETTENAGSTRQHAEAPAVQGDNGARRGGPDMHEGTARQRVEQGRRGVGQPNEVDPDRIDVLDDGTAAHPEHAAAHGDAATAPSGREVVRPPDDPRWSRADDAVSVTHADGRIGRIDADRNSSVRLGNGDELRVNSDGTHVIKPDGATARTPAERAVPNAESGDRAPTDANREQGPTQQTVITHPEGTTQTVRTDKTIEVRTPSDTTVHIDAKRNVTVHVSNETTIAVERKPVTVRSLNGDSYVVERKTVTVHTPDGTSYVVEPRRNTITRTVADPSAGSPNSGAAQGHGHPDATHTTGPDGTVRVRLGDGSTISIGRDGSVRVGLENGGATSVRADGVVRVTAPDRNSTVVRSDGMVWQVDPDGITVRRTSPDGSTWTVDVDGTIHQNKPDGTEKVHGTELSGTDLKSKTRPKRVPGARPKPSWVGIPDVPTAADWIAGASLPGSDGSSKPPE